MPLPLLIGLGIAAAVAAGAGAGIKGGVDMKKSGDTQKEAQKIQEEAIAKFEKINSDATTSMDRLGKLELEVLGSFSKFSDIMERVKNKPEFATITVDGVTLPKYEKEELNKVSIGAGALLGGLTGAGLGTAAGFAAAGATTAAVMAFGTASTGAAIGSLSGVALTNATLAAIGGGALAAGGLGVAGGTAILGASTAGVGLLIGGVVFGIVGGAMKNKANKTLEKAKEIREKVDNICRYLDDLNHLSDCYYNTLNRIADAYYTRLDKFEHLVKFELKTNWGDFNASEKTMINNLVLLVGMIFSMCKVKLVNQAEKEDELNTINEQEAREKIKAGETMLNNKLALEI